MRAHGQHTGGPSSPFRVSVCAARTLNATGQIPLSLRQEHLRAALWATPGGKGPDSRQKTILAAGAGGHGLAAAPPAKDRGARRGDGRRLGPLLNGVHLLSFKNVAQVNHDSARARAQLYKRLYDQFSYS